MALGMGGLASGFLAGGGASGIKALSKALMPKEQATSAPLPLPEAPSVDNAQAKGQEMAKRKRATNTKSVYTSPLGAAGEANIARKTLLGQ